MENGTLKKFGFALKGIATALKEEVHLRFHFIAALCVLIASFYFQLAPSDWIAIVICIAIVIFAELVNSALENLVDLVQPDHHPLAGKVKDIAAGAVLLVSMMAIAVGAIIFWPHICSILN